MLTRKAEILVHIEGDDICEAHFACLIHLSQLVVNADR